MYDHNDNDNDNNNNNNNGNHNNSHDNITTNVAARPQPRGLDLEAEPANPLLASAPALPTPPPGVEARLEGELGGSQGRNPK